MYCCSSDVLDFKVWNRCCRTRKITAVRALIPIAGREAWSSVRKVAQATSRKVAGDSSSSKRNPKACLHWLAMIRMAAAVT